MSDKIRKNGPGSEACRIRAFGQEKIAFDKRGLVARVNLKNFRYDKTSVCQEAPVAGMKLLGTFVGTTPCDASVRGIHRIPRETGCDEIEWRLHLYQNEKTEKPTSFSLDSEYRFYVDNRTTRTVGTNAGIHGNWTRETEGGSVVYVLTTDDGVVITFRKLDDHLLHPLEKNKGLMVGSDGQSYTLTRIK